MMRFMAIGTLSLVDDQNIFPNFQCQSNLLGRVKHQMSHSLLYIWMTMMSTHGRPSAPLQDHNWHTEIQLNLPHPCQRLTHDMCHVTFFLFCVDTGVPHAWRTGLRPACYILWVSHWTDSTSFLHAMSTLQQPKASNRNCCIFQSIDLYTNPSVW